MIAANIPLFDYICLVRLRTIKIFEVSVHLPGGSPAHSG